VTFVVNLPGLAFGCSPRLRGRVWFFRSLDVPITGSPDLCTPPPSPGIPLHPRVSQFGVTLRVFDPNHPTLA
jgi:hypothetical protein